ncbi:MAG: GntR family transcriptional regulator [Oscillospiraceae bacterium]|nr:GntR family transcriptional regulator [Oscillospiraceae bacterium]
MLRGMRIKWHSDISYSEQIEQKIKKQISLGYLEKGEQLPRCKVLGEKLKVCGITVYRAYRKLIEAGLVVRKDNDFYVN